MNIETLKQILEKIPEDYEVRYQDNIVKSNVNTKSTMVINQKSLTKNYYYTYYASENHVKL